MVRPRAEIRRGWSQVQRITQLEYDADSHDADIAKIVKGQNRLTVSMYTAAITFLTSTVFLALNLVAGRH